MKNYLTLGVLIAVGIGVAFAVSSGNTAVPAVAQVYAQNADFVYEDYSEERFNELKGSEAFSVFVHSRNCGTCAKKNQQIINEVRQFDEGAILKMEYDEAPQSFLKEHSVTKYDTFVNFDAEGNATTVKGAKVDDVRDGLSAPSAAVSPSSSDVIVQNASFVYANYSDERFDELVGNEAFSVFVHSRSCGTCAKKNQQIQDELASFDGGAILKMEYDEAPQSFLKEHGVTKYDTFVTFAADGTATTMKGAKVEDVRKAI